MKNIPCLSIYEYFLFLRSVLEEYFHSQTRRIYQSSHNSFTKDNKNSSPPKLPNPLESTLHSSTIIYRSTTFNKLTNVLRKLRTWIIDFPLTIL